MFVIGNHIGMKANFSHFCIARPDTVTTTMVLSQCPVSVLALWIGAQVTGTA